MALAAQRGVEVSLLIGVGEIWLQDMVARSFYPKLLDSGVKVIEYRKTQLHAKVAVIDDDWATVGSSNCDGLSLFLNQEANVVVRDATFARSMRAHIERGIADGVVIQREDFKQVGWVRRTGYEVAYFFYKLTMRIFTIGLCMMENVRIDKWLWAARFFKTRSLATDAVDTGRVRMEGERIKPAGGKAWR
jgi:cardiolipin synthase